MFGNVWYYKLILACPDESIIILSLTANWLYENNMKIWKYILGGRS